MNSTSVGTRKDRIQTHFVTAQSSKNLTRHGEASGREVSKGQKYSDKVTPGLAPIKRILVMDDEPMVRDITGKMLSRAGYQVDFAGDGTAAIERYKRARESGEPFDAVILDLTNKSGMGGLEAIEILLQIDPGVRAIITTGYTYDPVLTHYRQCGFHGALAKPFTMDELYRTVKQVMQ
jgi:CheY-like chemotaxis protein